jgi:hypothetical protein
MIMKTTRYQFEKDIEGASSNTDWLKQSFQSILESDKHFTAKADYIGYSILGIDEKVQSLDEQIKELQAVKKRLKEAKEVALTVGAEVLTDYGIDKLEGAGISSITVTESKDKTDLELIIHDENALMELGYYFKVLDSARVIEEFNKADERGRLEAYCDVVVTTTVTDAKLKINKRRSANTTDFNASLNLQEAI